MKWYQPGFWKLRENAPFPWVGVLITVLLLLAFITAGALLAPTI